MAQVSRASGAKASESSHGSKYHVARLVVHPGDDAKDTVAYLSPILAFNMGFQMHLEAFLFTPEQGQLRKATSKPASSTGAMEDHALSTDAEEKSQGRFRHRVQVSRLEKPENDEDYCSVSQPGK